MKRTFVYSTAESPKLIPGRRDFLDFFDLGVADASQGHFSVQVIKTVPGKSVRLTGWHYHDCESQFCYVLKGWVDIAFEDGTSRRMHVGDSFYIPGGVRHNESAISDDYELLEVVVPPNMTTQECDPPEAFKKSEA